MRLRHITGSETAVAESAYVAHEPAQYRGRWQEFFGNTHPIYMEIGMGKGQFITRMAELHPERNFIGVERYDTVLLKALNKRAAAEERGTELKNLTFLSLDARLVEEIFAPGEIAGIYLNFSDPWPKDGHANRRLTSPVFLSYYRKILQPEGELQFKTDNQMLFDYSLEAIPAAGWQITAFTRDLHKDSEMNAGNVMTEYEEKFSGRGNPIYKLIARQSG